MPQVVAAAVAYAGGTLTAGAVIGAVIEAAVFINGINQARRARKAAQAAQAAIDGERTSRSFRSSDAPRDIVYGRVRKGGVVVYAVRHPHQDREIQTIVIALAGHECDAIEDVWFNDESIGTLDANGWTTSGRYHISEVRPLTEQFAGPNTGGSVTVSKTPVEITSVTYTDLAGGEIGDQRVLTLGTDYTVSGATVTFLGDRQRDYPLFVNYTYTYTKPLVRVKKYLGITAGERDTDLETDSGGEWTSADVGKGVCRIHVTIDFDQNVFGQLGVPNISVIMRGKKVRNWSTGTSSWSSNAARCQLDYLTSSMGLGVPIAKVNEAYAQSAQSACEETVQIDAGGATQLRYTVDGVVSTDGTRRDNLDMLLGASVGSLVHSAGQWYIRAGVYASPVFTLDESDLAGDSLTIQPAVSRHEVFNGVRGRFVDADNSYLTNDFPPYLSATYQAADNGQAIYADVQLPMTTNVLRAQRVAKLLLHRSRQGLIFTADWKLSAYAVQPGDTVRVKIARYGWDTVDSGLGKVFRVMQRALTIGETASIRLTMQEEASALYSWAYNEATDPDPAPNTALPDPGVIQALAGFTVTSNDSTYDVLGDGTIQPYAMVTWLLITDIKVLEAGKIVVWWKRANSLTYNKLSILPGDTSVKLVGVARGELIDVKARCESAAGALGPLSLASHTVDANIPTNLVEVPQSGNLIRNASFATGTQHWSVSSSAGSSPTFTRDTVAPIPGVPTNAVLVQITANSADLITATAGTMAVRPGWDYVAFAGLAPLRCTARLVVTFYSSAGAVLSTHQSAYVAAGSTPTTASGYTTAEVMVTAPASSAYAIWKIEKTGTASGSTSEARVLEPYFGKSTAAVRPIWSDGPPPEATQASNHLENSTFAYGTEGWVTDTGGGHAGTVTFEKELVYPVAGFPTSARLATTSTQVSTGAYLLATAADVSVSPGTWWGVACKAIPVGARFTVDVLWFDGAGALISSQACSSIAPMTAPSAVPAPSSFGISSGIFIAPATARKMRVRLDMYDFSAATPYAHVLQPMVAPVPVGAADVPLWAPGPVGRVSTAQVAPGAVAPVMEVVQASVAVPATTSGSTPQITATLLTPVEIGTPLLVTISGVVSVASSANYCLGRFGGPIVNIGSVTRPATSYVHILDSVDGVTSGKQFTHSFHTTSSAKGTGATFSFYVAAGGGGGAVTLTDLRLRVEARKA